MRCIGSLYIYIYIYAPHMPPPTDQKISVRNPCNSTLAIFPALGTAIFFRLTMKLVGLPKSRQKLMGKVQFPNFSRTERIFLRTIYFQKTAPDFLFLTRGRFWSILAWKILVTGLIVRFRTQFAKRIHPGAHRARIRLFKISSLSHVCSEHTYFSEQYIFKIQTYKKVLLYI